MVRVSNLDESLDFYCNKLGLKQVKRMDHEAGRFTLVFVAPPGQEDCAIELTHNWDPEQYTGGRNFGHQSTATRRQNGVHPFAGQYFDRAAAEGRGAAEGRAVGVDAEHGQLVS
jgi:catechol 2,3-dioxygenase-like lactoylglutathione lyase family enzyme